MRRTLLALTTALSLSACIEVDMTLEVLGQDEAKVTGFMQMNRQMFDMSGGDTSFCAAEEGGTLVLTETHARCNFEKSGTFAEVMPKTPGAEDDPEGELIYLDSNRVRAMMPMGAMNAGVADMQEDPQMEAMMRQMLAGLSVAVRVKGAKIESSTGVISEDGTQASITLGVDDLFDKSRPEIVDFDTIVTY
jgi:hypothetical protein